MKKLLIIIVSLNISTVVFSNAVQSRSIITQQKFNAIEKNSDVRLGVFAIDTNNNRHIQYHALERFPLCSTNKVIGVSAILKKSMKDPAFLSKKIVYTKQDLLSWSPITAQYVTTGMTISALCQAVLTQSDNTAINLLMREIGGPKGVTAFARSIGDNTFRLDRWEPQLNSAIPGDLRDTSTPEAMAKSLQKLALGNVLGLTQRQQLQQWLKDNTTGKAGIHAGVPIHWVVGDKTGSGDYGTKNDIGIIWPPHCKPIIMAVYSTKNNKNALPDNAVISRATRIAIDALSQKDLCMLKNITR